MRKNKHDESESDPPETSTRSRRQLIAGAVGAAGALAASAVVTATPAQAGTDGDVVLGADYQATSTSTGISCSGPLAFRAESTSSTSPTALRADAPDPSGTGVYAIAGSLGVQGIGSTGVSGIATGSGSGVFGTSGSGNGVEGQVSGSAGIGVYGVHKAGGTALQGSSVTAGGIGCVGLGAKYGVWGLPSDASGIGVLATSTFNGTGTALSVIGPAQFDRSGVVSIKYPAKSASVPMPEPLTKASLALATLQNNIPGVYVACAVPNLKAGTITITLNKAPGSASTPLTANVGWFVVN